MAQPTAILFMDARSLVKAKALSQKLTLPLYDNSNSLRSQGHMLYYVVASDQLGLQDESISGSKPLWIDYLSTQFRRRCSQARIQETIVKAVGLKKAPHLKILDLTAGLGYDSCLLASLDWEVTMIERSEVVGNLLCDALERMSDALPESHLPRLVQGDSRDYLLKLRSLKPRGGPSKVYPTACYPEVSHPDGIYPDVVYPDVIYIDPMFPDLNKSALPKKSMRILREVVEDLDNAKELLDMSLPIAKKRVVIKRPRMAPAVSDRKPDITYSGASCRFDVFLSEAT